MTQASPGILVAVSPLLASAGLSNGSLQALSLGRLLERFCISSLYSHSQFLIAFILIDKMSSCVLECNTTRIPQAVFNT